jgi:hypothetical protein
VTRPASGGELDGFEGQMLEREIAVLECAAQAVAVAGLAAAKIPRAGVRHAARATQQPTEGFPGRSQPAGHRNGDRLWRRQTWLCSIGTCVVTPVPALVDEAAGMIAA